MRRFTYKLNRDIIFKNRYKTDEFNSVIQHIIFSDFAHSQFFPFFFYKKYFRYNSMVTRFRHRCLFTGRFRGYLSFMHCSRFVFKKYALNGFFVGVKKAS
jgi:ribosomal protein S14